MSPYDESIIYELCQTKLDNLDEITNLINQNDRLRKEIKENTKKIRSIQSENRRLTFAAIADILGVDRTTVLRAYRKMFK